MRELSRRDQDRLKLRGLLLAGAESRPAAAVNARWFKDLRADVRKIAKGQART